MTIKSPIRLTLLSAAILATLPLHAAGVAPDASAAAKGSYIVVLKPELTDAQVSNLATQISQRENGQLRHVFTTALKGFSATLPEPALEHIASNPSVLYVEANGVVHLVDEMSSQQKPSNPGKGGGGGGDTPGSQTTPAGVARVGGPRDGTGKDAWVIDTGIDSGHADLNVGAGANFVLRGKNTTNDGNGHGTHVAGTIGAIDNSIDVVGVAANAKVHPIRVLDNTGSGTIDGVIAGVDYVAAHAAAGDAANMSLGASGHFQSLHDAIVNAASLGIRFAIAAGNSSDYAMNSEPAHIEHPSVYTFSAVNDADVYASFSNYGNPPIDFAAPGVSVLSTKKGGGVTTLSGTSMATPHVTGILLLQTPVADGYAISDPDGIPDPVAHY